LFANFLWAEKLFLNKKERLWIQNRTKPVLVGITEIPNQILKTKNGYEGYFIDLFKIISDKLDLKFKYVYFDTWSELINAAKKGKIDVVFAAQKTPSRLKYLDFTDTVLIQKNNILENINNNNFHSIEDLNFKKVAVTKGSAIEEYLKYSYPKIKLILTNNELTSLKLLNSSEVDAAIAETVRAGYYINKYNLNNIVPGPDLNYDYYLSIATVANETMLNTLLTKAVTHIPKKKFKALKLKWGYLKEKVTFFNTQTIIFLSIVAILILSFLMYLFYINRKLKKEIEQKEEALKRIQFLRNSKLSQMSEIINMIAHQWKQPLNNLALLIQFIANKYKNEELTEENFNYFQINAVKQIDLMLQTINDFKELFSQHESKKKFNIIDIMNGILDTIKPIYEKNGIKISFKSFSKNVEIEGYPELFKQIIYNIINNAKDALIERNVQNKEIFIFIKKTKSNIIIEIEDNAGGIPLDIIDKIFEPYFSTKKNGTGLGLYMAKILLEEKMNATIEVFNTKKGAEFQIIFNIS